MKKSIILFSFILLIFANMTAQKKANQYDSDWKQVIKHEEADLVQSAAKEVDFILKKAIAEKNTQQIIKAYLHKNKYKIAINDEDNIGIFSDLESIVSQTSDANEKALLHSILAELYLEYYKKDRWTINSRTNLSDIVPNDMKEWTANIFADKTIQHINSSVDAKTLKETTTKEYSEIIILGEDSPTLYPTLYDFLMKRAIEISRNIPPSNNNYRTDIQSTGFTIEQLAVSTEKFVDLKIEKSRDNIVLFYYQQYLKDLLSRGLTPTLIMTELDKVGYLENIAYSFQNKESLDFLYLLKEKYSKDETSVEIIDAIAQRLGQHRNNDLTETNTKIYELCQNGIKQYPNYKRINILKQRIEILEQPTLAAKGKDIYHPEQDAEVVFSHRNLQSLANYPALSLYRIEGKDSVLVKEIPVHISSKTSYNTDEVTINLGKLKNGAYRLSDGSGSTQTKFNFNVTRLTSYSRNNAKHSYEIYIVDRISGKPIEGATAKIYKKISRRNQDKPTLVTSLKSDKSGLVSFKDIKDINTKNYFNGYYTVSLGDDNAEVQQSINQNYQFEISPITREADIERERSRKEVSIFTDRGIYRPGQTVYYKAVVASGEQKLVSNAKVTVTLKNANYEDVTSNTLVTNEFGSVAGEFILPQSGLLGQYTIEIKQDDNTYNSYYFSVEEYKRPTFEITFDKVEKTYSFGEEVTIKGYAKNFSGINLQDATVKYNVEGNQFSFWRWGGGEQTFYDTGTVTTDANGAFEIKFTPEAGDLRPSLLRGGNNIQRYVVNAEVTDLNNETQSGQFSMIVGDVSMTIGVSIPDQIEKSDKTNVTINARNLNDQPIETMGTYSIFSLNENDSIASKVLDGAFKTGEQKDLRTSINKLASGKYQINIKALDSNSKEVQDSSKFVLYSYEDKKPPIKTNEWLVTKSNTFGPNKNAEIILGVSDKDVHVLYQIYNEKKVFSSERLTLSNANKTFSIPYKAEYGEGVYVNLVYIKDEKFYNKNIFIQKEKAKIDNKLNVTLKVFRDKLRPGQEETWTISVKDAKENPVIAELLASMYDASLDKLGSISRWSLNYPYISEKGTGIVYFSDPFSYNTNGYFRHFDLNNNRKTIDIHYLEFDQINLFGFSFNSYGIMIRGAASPSARKEKLHVSIADVKGTDDKFGVDIAELKEHKVILSEDANTGLLGENAVIAFTPPPAAPEAGGGAESTTPPQIRQNFSETAFFYPQLRTNENGETLITFTVPESNTTWKFRALAHDKNAQIGQMEQMVVSRKELMVTPNMPRFVRQGDKTNISTKVSNLSEKELNGEVYIEFFDPITDEAINLNIADLKQSFALAQGASTSVNWTFDIPNDIELLGCRIVANNESFSDGEQHVLSVLTNRMLVTETMPFDVIEKGESAFSFDKLKNSQSASLQNYRLTFEYTANPAWYAVQALPTMSNPNGDNAVSWFASYYVNTMGASIVKRYPKVANVIQAWKKQGGNKETLLSKLQKNEELKSVLLAETPWVLDAKTEAEQMERLSLLFDLNNTKSLTSTAVDKLSNLQDQNLGGWTWYKGMYPSRSISQYILYGFAELQLTGQVEYPDKIKMMQMSALKFIDGEIKSDFDNLKKNNKKWSENKHISTNQLEYLYVRSFYRDIPINQETREAERFYTSIASKNWKELGLYERALLSIVLHRNGEKELAKNIVNTIRERSVVDNKGIYWPNVRSHAFLSLSAVSTHTFLMEALLENGASEKDMNLMKQWLIKQKQTQVWESTHASMLAINTLLRTGSDWFSGETIATQIKVGDKTIETNKGDLGTGYVKTTWNKSDINANMANVRISRESDQPSYGALYWQYYEDLDKITSHKSNLNIDKLLFKEVGTGAGKTLASITEATPLSVGDKVVVRLTVRVDNDMEFVQIKDMRAPCFEPVETTSSTKWQNNAMYYQETRDASTNFFFDLLRKGTYVFEYSAYVNRTGEYSNGITSIQCLYAPEFSSHTQGIKVNVK